jgi:hypothetical protein
MKGLNMNIKNKIKIMKGLCFAIIFNAANLMFAELDCQLHINTQGFLREVAMLMKDTCTVTTYLHEGSLTEIYVNNDAKLRGNLAGDAVKAAPFSCLQNRIGLNFKVGDKFPIGNIQKFWSGLSSAERIEPEPSLIDAIHDSVDNGKRLVVNAWNRFKGWCLHKQIPGSEKLGEASNDDANALMQEMTNNNATFTQWLNEQSKQIVPYDETQSNGLYDFDCGVWINGKRVGNAHNGVLMIFDEARERMVANFDEILKNNQDFAGKYMELMNYLYAQPHGTEIANKFWKGLCFGVSLGNPILTLITEGFSAPVGILLECIVTIIATLGTAIF